MFDGLSYCSATLLLLIPAFERVSKFNLDALGGTSKLVVLKANEFERSFLGFSSTMLP
jgi:hypothetical protein